MTIMFRPYDLLVKNYDLGRPVTLRVVGHAYDDKVQAVCVHGVLSVNANPHITISYDMDKGGKPKDSNEMLSKALREETLVLASMNIDLEGLIDVFPRSTT